MYIIINIVNVVYVIIIIIVVSQQESNAGRPATLSRRGHWSIYCYYVWQIGKVIASVTHVVVCVPVCVWTDELSKSAVTLFDDVVEEFCEVDLIRGRFETWKKDYSDSYNEAFIGLCLPKLFTPFVKLELVCWNPLEVRIIIFWPIFNR